MSDQLHDAGVAAAVDREHESRAQAEAERAKRNLPWLRADDGSIVYRYMESRVDVEYLGPFRVGDTVVVNRDDVAVVIEYAGRTGMLVVPKMPRTMITQDPGRWYPVAGITSITPAANIDVPEPLRYRPVFAPEPSGDPDESLPMNPPPMQPGIEATFG